MFSNGWVSLDKFEKSSREDDQLGPLQIIIVYYRH